MNQRTKMTSKVVSGVFMMVLLMGCSEQRTIWDTNGAYQGREVWNTGGKKLNTPKHFWVNSKGEEVFWKKKGNSESENSNSESGNVL